MLKRLLLAGAAAIALSAAQGTAAQAADVVDDPAPEMTDWSGFYIGAHVGYGWANMSGCHDCTDANSNLEGEDLDLAGIIGGLHAGHNWQRDSLVFGIEGDVSFTDMNDREQQEENDTTEHEGEVDLLASVRARLGVAVDDALLYVTGGIAIPDARWTLDTEDDTENADFSDIGGVAGVGVEFAATQTFRLRAEALYYFFEDAEGISDFTDANTGEEMELEDVIVVRGGVSIYLN